MASSTYDVIPESAYLTSEQLDPQEMAAVEKINEIPMGFKIWSQGRREDTPQDRALEGQCKTQVFGHDNRIRLNGNGNSATQTFSACSEGVLEHISVGIQASFDPSLTHRKGFGYTLDL